jgi:hypothetical protein
MADAVYVTVSGERRVALKLDEFPQELRGQLEARISELTAELQAQVEAAAPSRTGKLKSEIRGRVFADNPKHVSGIVDVYAPKGSGEFAKAAALEYGASASTNVSTHPMKLDHYWADKLAAPTTVLVAAHSRTVNIAEHDFLRGPLAAMEPQIQMALEEVVEAATIEADA